MTRPIFDTLLITCEHASNAVPERWQRAFASDRAVLQTHRAWDPGAMVLASELAARFKAPLHVGKFTRMLIDLNRRQVSKAAFSSFTPEHAKAELLKFHGQWRSAVLESARRLKGCLLHISCHSFTPALKGVVRRADLGLLYDPRRKLERTTADAWHAQLAETLPAMCIRRNSPYRGISDGITTWLRRQMGNRYAGFELELNQSFAAKPPIAWAAVRMAIITAVRESL